MSCVTAAAGARRRGRQGGRQLGSLVPITDTGEWTPTSLPPVYDRGRGRASRKASRCRSRVRVPSVTPTSLPPVYGPGGAGGRAVGESMPFPRPRFRQWTPTSLPPVYDRGRGRASRRRVDAVPASAFPSVDPNVTAPGLRPGAREGEPQGESMPFPRPRSVSGPQRHCPRSTTGGRGRASRKASRCRSRVRVPSVDPNVTAPGLRPGGAGGRAARRVDAVPASAFAVAASRRSCETFLGCRVRVVCDRARSRCQGRQPRAAGAERSDAP